MSRKRIFRIVFAEEIWKRQNFNIFFPLLSSSTHKGGGGVRMTFNYFSCGEEVVFSFCQCSCFALRHSTRNESCVRVIKGMILSGGDFSGIHEGGWRMSQHLSSFKAS